MFGWTNSPPNKINNYKHVSYFLLGSKGKWGNRKRKERKKRQIWPLIIYMCIYMNICVYIFIHAYISLDLWNWR